MLGTVSTRSMMSTTKRILSGKPLNVNRPFYPNRVNIFVQQKRTMHEQQQVNLSTFSSFEPEYFFN